MKVTGIFFNGVRIGTYSGDTAYIGDFKTELDSSYTLKEINVRGLKVYVKTNEVEASTHGTVMELVEREGGLAVVKDSCNNERVAVLHKTCVTRHGKILVLSPIVNQREKKVFPERYKKRWILMK